MTKTLIDTSFAIALISEKDESHEKALALSYEYGRKPMLITDSVILEIGNSLSRRHRQKFVDTVEGFFASPEVEISRLNETLFNKAFELYKFHQDKTWGLVDCISFVAMREHNITSALTSDKHFVQAGFRALMLDLEN